MPRVDYFQNGYSIIPTITATKTISIIFIMLYIPVNIAEKTTTTKITMFML